MRATLGAADGATTEDLASQIAAVPDVTRWREDRPRDPPGGRRRTVRPRGPGPHRL